MAMSNTSIFFLSENSLDLNCSVYSLTSGSIQFQDLTNDSWSRNYTTGGFLPAYYVTNCSIPDLIDQIRDIENTSLISNSSSKEWADQYKCSPYNQNDNGDTFIALLFTISGACVSCWMLSLIFFLSPPKKRKPVLTQLATIFYTIVTTILLYHITDTASKEFYDDTLDIISIYHNIYTIVSYRVTIVISQLLTQLAIYQIVVSKLTRSRYKWQSGFIGAILIAAQVSMTIVYQIKFNTTDVIFFDTFSKSDFISYRGVVMSRAILKILVMVWFGLSLINYTTSIKNPRKVCYSRRLIALALIVWCLFILHIVLSILVISLYWRDWLVYIWLGIIPYLIEIYILSVVCEWVNSIKFIEKRHELMGVLGRRISIDDVISFRDDDENDVKSRKKNDDKAKFGSMRHFFNHLSGVFIGNRRRSVSSVSTASTLFNKSYYKHGPTTNSNSQNDSKVSFKASTDSTGNDLQVPTLSPTPTRTPTLQRNNSITSHNSQSDESFDIEYVDYDYMDGAGSTNLQNEHQSLLDAPQEGSSSQQQPQPRNESSPPPPFIPHPGYNHEDYWPDEKGS